MQSLPVYSDLCAICEGVYDAEMRANGYEHGPRTFRTCSGCERRISEQCAKPGETFWLFCWNGVRDMCRDCLELTEPAEGRLLKAATKMQSLRRGETSRRNVAAMKTAQALTPAHKKAKLTDEQAKAAGIMLG